MNFPFLLDLLKSKKFNDPSRRGPRRLGLAVVTHGG
jgi:hypothetical protein